jgi:subtilisin
MLIDSHWIRKIALRVTVMVPFMMYGSAHVLLAQGAQDYIVRFREGANAAARATVVRNAGAALGVNFHRVNASAVKVPNARALAALQNDPSVLAVIPNRSVSAYQVNGNVKGESGKGKPGGGGGGAAQVIPAGVVRVGSPTGISNGSGVGVAVLDTGVDLAHADLVGTVDAFNGFGGPSCQDDQGHGTHVTGIIAARDNSVDVVGVAPGAQIYCVKVLDSAGSGSDATVMAGLEWVLDHHASSVPNIKVVNMSLGRAGSVDDNPDLHDLITSLETAGITVVVAAGNDASLEASGQIPAGYPEVVAVASTTAQAGSNLCRLLSSPIAADTASYFTSDGVSVTVSAPGEEKEDVARSCLITSVGILSTRLGGGTTRMSGTSMASPHVAGIVVRYYQQNPLYTVGDIRQFLKSDADRVGVAPLGSPTGSYTFDGEREGIAQGP